RGERERLVYLIDGSDTGWRINWQFGKYTDPDNNNYKVWMDEQLHIPRWDGQAAYILPAIKNYVNGPTGMVYNPGTALGPEWYKHFFLAEFRGSPSNSPIHAFTLKPDGAGFALDTTREVVRGLLPTGLDFGADGALYFGDWINGWGTKQEGRIWKLDVPGEQESDIRQETKALLNEDFGDRNNEDLAKLLGHQDMRVRRKAQFELADRGNKGLRSLEAVASGDGPQLARIHALWGITQQARVSASTGAKLVPFLADTDPEIVAQAAKLIGDIRYVGATNDLLVALERPEPRVQFFATEALGRTAAIEAIPAILSMLETNGDQDTWLRMVGMIALGRIGEASPLEALKDHPSKALRTAAVVALRRMESPAIAAFLNDSDEFVATEAARGINDDFSIPAALPALAKALAGTTYTGEPFLRRAINANSRVGDAASVQRLVDFINNDAASAAMRAEAVATLSVWAKPSVFDRVDGRYRGEVERDAAAVKSSMAPIIAGLLDHAETDLSIAAIRAAAKLDMKATIPSLVAILQGDRPTQHRIEALQALDLLEAEELESVLQFALADRSPELRASALALLPKSTIGAELAVPLYEDIIATGTVQEQQAALIGLGELEGEAARDLLTRLLDQLEAGQLPAEVHLDLVEAIEKQEDEAFTAQLTAYGEALSPELGLFETALAGGNPGAGRGIFYWNESAQCTRCHAVFEYGGNVGPGLSGVADRLDKRNLLTSVIRPSMHLAPGYETVLVELTDSTATAGIVLERTPEALKLKIGKEDIKTIPRSSIVSEESLP
ncbi:MAG: HEAT repeat domain-containing protein, partial [Bacteroidota bacterium]